jgi:hypothetical protein
MAWRYLKTSMLGAAAASSNDDDDLVAAAAVVIQELGRKRRWGGLGWLQQDPLKCPVP